MDLKSIVCSDIPSRRMSDPTTCNTTALALSAASSPSSASSPSTALGVSSLPSPQLSPNEFSSSNYTTDPTSPLQQQQQLASSSYQKSVESDSELPDTNSSASGASKQPSSSRRFAHILSEQRRRENINGGFIELKGSIPECRGSQDSKAVILRKAVLYIASLESELAPCVSTKIASGCISAALISACTVTTTATTTTTATATATTSTTTAADTCSSYADGTEFDVDSISWSYRTHGVSCFASVADAPIYAASSDPDAYPAAYAAADLRSAAFYASASDDKYADAASSSSYDNVCLSTTVTITYASSAATYADPAYSATVASTANVGDYFCSSYLLLCCSDEYAVSSSADAAPTATDRGGDAVDWSNLERAIRKLFDCSDTS
ncbi:uncharacterized protein V2V93DRAFT_170388 [Kockiozyma suomiensis]|uniref:uncharacterized protein n=1 Tax=Kockiozyma suomiensis TaxID=1337062 RepID=UPI0033434F1D